MCSSLSDHSGRIPDRKGGPSVSQWSGVTTSDRAGCPAAGFRISRGMPRFVGALPSTPAMSGSRPQEMQETYTRALVAISSSFLSPVLLSRPPPPSHTIKMLASTRTATRALNTARPLLRQSFRGVATQAAGPSRQQSRHNGRWAFGAAALALPVSSYREAKLTQGSLLPDEQGHQARLVGRDAPRPAARHPPVRDREAQDWARGLGRHRRHRL